MMLNSLKKHLFFYVMLFFFTYLLGYSSASTLQIISTFDSNLEGWRSDGGVIEYISMGRYLKMKDTVNSSMYVIAPNKFLGNLLSFDEGVLSFDSKIFNPDVSYPDFGKIRINNLYLDIIDINPTQSWKSYSIPLKSSLWGVSQEEWEEVLSNVTNISVCLEAGQYVNEIMGFDNFTITATNDCAIFDSDNDGVIDQWDHCPNTPINSYVNKNGCPINRNSAVSGQVSVKGHPFTQGKVMLIQSGEIFQNDNLDANGFFSFENYAEEKPFSIIIRKKTDK
ncbi:conserved hypothetical protein, secreted [Candidatus Magnetomorum sp. HK-1]|nr:conserved hypothetical protein, secreted [Candidatus Magnetomorum sp. HK-1]